MSACYREEKEVKEAVGEVLPTCCASCCAVKVALCCSFVSVRLCSFLLSLWSLLLCTLISPHPLSCDFFHPYFCFILLFFFIVLPSSTIFKEAVTKIEEAQVVFVCSCCFTVWAPLLLHSVSRLQIHAVKNYRGL